MTLNLSHVLTGFDGYCRDNIRIVFCPLHFPDIFSSQSPKVLPTVPLCPRKFCINMCQGCAPSGSHEDVVNVLITGPFALKSVWTLGRFGPHLGCISIRDLLSAELARKLPAGTPYFHWNSFHLNCFYWDFCRLWRCRRIKHGISLRWFRKTILNSLSRTFDFIL